VILNLLQFQDIPIILVATNVVTTPSKTLNIAQEFGVSKYVEIQNNLYHILEIFTQTVNAIQTFHENSNVTTQQRIKYSAREREYFKSCLTVSPPEGDFDQMDRTFELTTLPNVSYYYTLDDSTPTYTSHRYVQKMKVKQHRIRVIGIERCKYRSQIAEFDVPEGIHIIIHYSLFFRKHFTKGLL
jgi:hypothetical protein